MPKACLECQRHRAVAGLRLQALLDHMLVQRSEELLDERGRQLQREYYEAMDRRTAHRAAARCEPIPKR